MIMDDNLVRYGLAVILDLRLGHLGFNHVMECQKVPGLWNFILDIF